MNRGNISVVVFAGGAFITGAGHQALLDPGGMDIGAQGLRFRAEGLVTAAVQGPDTQSCCHKDRHAEFTNGNAVDPLIQNIQGTGVGQMSIGCAGLGMLANESQGMPVTLSVVVAAVLWKWYVFDPNMGLVNNILNALGLSSLTRAWLGDSNTAMTCVILMSLWHGVATWVIMLISGLDRIPPDLMEAARIDGANELTVFFKITLPLLWEVLSSLIVMSFIGCMQQFPVVFAMTQGGPYGSTELMGTYLYKIAFEGRQFSYGSAMSIVMLVIILVASTFGNKFLKTETIEY